MSSPLFFLSKHPQPELQDLRETGGKERGNLTQEISRNFMKRNLLLFTYSKKETDKDFEFMILFDQRKNTSETLQ